ncbi:MAG: HNH endonuclease, partial [Chloroflexota bacterium]|nr:HNH endonuclease [Chloroflexota bacterium]
MIDKLSQALTLMREAFEDAQSGASSLASLDLAAEVDGAQHVINAASAVQVLRVAQYAAREEEQDPTGAWVVVDHGLGHVSEFASDCFGPMLAMGPVASSRKVVTAAALASRLPVTLAAMAAGDLDPWRASIISTELAEAGADSCAAIEALIFPKVLGEAPGAVTKRLRRVLARVDADAVRLKAAKERLDGFVKAYPSHVPGLTTWVAQIPAADSAACWAAIDDLAHQMRGGDPTRTLEQCRADALVDLMLTNVTVTTTVTLMIPVQTVTVDEPPDSREHDLIVCGTGSKSNTATGSALGYLNPLATTDDFGQPTPDPNPFIEPTWQQICAMGYEIPGIGVIGGDIVAGILERFDTRIARVLLDESTGVVIETSIETYLPNRAMRRFIQKRDGHCRFPGCQRGAKRCELDHVTPHSRGGPTAPWNLASLCKHHHRVKHEAGWALVMSRDGKCTWT